MLRSQLARVIVGALIGGVGAREKISHQIKLKKIPGEGRICFRTCIFFRESLTWRDAVRAVIPRKSP